mgnify:CR=1 FL=1
MPYKDEAQVERKKKEEWERLGFSSPEAYEDAKAASLEMFNIEYLMGVDDALPEGYKMNQGPGKVLTALGLYGDQTDNPQSSQPANIRSYTRPVGSRNRRTLGRYIPTHETYSAELRDPEFLQQMLDEQYGGLQGAMLGGPTQEDDIFADLTTQYNELEGEPYEDTLKHELRHRGFASERMRDHLTQQREEGKEVPWWKDRWEHSKDAAMSDAASTKKGQHELYEIIRQLQLGETSRGDLYSWNERKLRNLERLEAAILEGMTEEQRMQLGFLPEKEEAGFIDKLLGIMD